MLRKRLIFGLIVVAAVVGGSVGAIAASRDDDAKKTEEAILADAAKRLDVSPERLRQALSDAEDAQLDQAVKDGKLTQAQADDIKAYREREGRVLGIPPHGGPGFRHHGGPKLFGPGFGPRMEILADLARAVGLSQSELLERFRDGKSVQEIAKAQGKSLAEVKKAVKAALAKRLADDVKAKRLTDAQRDEILEHFDARIEMLGDARKGRFGPGGPPGGFRGGGFRGGGPPPFVVPGRDVQ